ncbi:MAG: oligopeptide transporter permease [Oceanicaulis sp.]|jgi:oligopeptide transport system permease protein|uniref:ABC transporter permease subunit n=1 Tax=unclassified Oceanicaulis TaxID=2632123 RepID=UPI000066BBCB|nr:MULTISPECIES: ABC transporter permease subunit [unclassified Oceanicaulis]MAB69343.1 oligopeptide transporter permease [Oceanicaulis sp.]EAP89108.1 oligopeptide ABC transporter, permease protein [Oceanicaulis alexandrii HTCC2633] [Oceanicaulis sp. HTCC2633]MBG35106.1 oligopeptide transporter permease [Oceanicaulis sp.]HBU63723.1 oligopeptide transporter permease [Oceanicaulis sp.]HCR95483.1 oligopeptide transporter permease [Oceanicaulis sp.]|tara:strand:+ start:918 stop:1850 length:933 start_codon:yes stop_codon:yes gene_type:complete
MIGYIARRILVAIPTLLVIITLAFFMMRFAPGGPFDLERPMPEQTRQNLLASYGMDQPVAKQYLDYLVDLAQFDLGPSLKFRDKTVAQIISEGFPVSATVGLLSMALAVIVGTALGSIAALRQNTAADYGVVGFATVGIVIPPFVVGPILALVIGIYLGWLPSGGLDPRHGMTLERLILPVVTLALPQIAIISRLMRASMIEVIRSNFIRTARAKGLSPFAVITRHALRAAILPLVSYLGPATAALLTGSIVIEQVFSLPGVGRQFVFAALQRDYTVVMGVVILYASLIILLNLIADLLYAVLNPKVKFD